MKPDFDIAYDLPPSDTDAARIRRLDVHPAAADDAPLFIWFHGGGLEGGDKGDGQDLARRLNAEGISVVLPNYRLSPDVTFPAYVDDAAAAVSWCLRPGNPYGFKAGSTFVGGHSAGAYLALLATMDPRYLQAHDLLARDLAGVISACGQTLTHHAINAERGIPRDRYLADEAAPLAHVRTDLPPFLLMASEHDLPMRVEQTRLLEAALRLKNVPVESHLALNRDHGGFYGDPAQPDNPEMLRIVTFIRRHSS